MSGIFISYRRDDSRGHTGRIYDGLVGRFGADRVFLDVDAVEPGDDFVDKLTSAVASCDACVVVIGARWLHEDEDGRLRLQEARDFVRIEIEAALQKDVPITPALVDGARMPRSEDLPESIRPLTRRQAVELSDLRWQGDMDRLVRALSRWLDRSEQELEAETAREALKKAVREYRQKEGLRDDQSVLDPLLERQWDLVFRGMLVELHPRIATADFDNKKNEVVRYLREDRPVTVQVRFDLRVRPGVRKKKAEDLLARLAGEVAEFGFVEGGPRRYDAGLEILLLPSDRMVDRWKFAPRKPHVP